MKVHTSLAERIINAICDGRVHGLQCTRKFGTDPGDERKCFDDLNVLISKFQDSTHCARHANFGFVSPTAHPDAEAYFHSAPERLACTKHGRALVRALGEARAEIEEIHQDRLYLLRQIGELRSELNTERAMRRTEGP